MLGIKSLSIKEYAIAALAVGGLGVLVAAYLWLQFGQFDRFTLNRSIAEASLLGLALVLLIGPLTRLFDKLDHWLPYRKEIGILSFVAATAHWLISGLALPGRTWAGFFGRNPLSFYAGSFALLLFVILFVSSLELVISRIPRRFWWALQNWGVRLAGILVVAHVFFLRRTAWIAWFNQGNTNAMLRPFLPPITVITGIVALAVILVRLSEFLGKTWARRAVQLILVAIPLAWAATIWWTVMKMP